MNAQRKFHVLLWENVEDYDAGLGADRIASVVARSASQAEQIAEQTYGNRYDTIETAE